MREGQSQIKTTMLVAATVVAAVIACAKAPPVATKGVPKAGPGQTPTSADRIALETTSGLSEHLPTTNASPQFWKHWGDGKAELSGYSITTTRYGEQRTGTVALIYVTETMNRKTWIKDDDGTTPEADRVAVIKLNNSLKFQTGIYPYSVMTSVFSPVNSVGKERFAPAKISASAQEWCGHVYRQVHPKGDHYWSESHSYFAAEGNNAEEVATPAAVLYEDALLIQLRELDGPFADGDDWKGHLVPSLWSVRKSHGPASPVPATITRSDSVSGETPTTRFTLSYGKTTRIFHVEKADPRRVIAWQSNDGEKATILGSERLAYWKLNRPGDESHLKSLGLE